jgi:hypothetical protein
VFRCAQFPFLLHVGVESVKFVRVCHVVSTSDSFLPRRDWHVKPSARTLRQNERRFARLSRRFGLAEPKYR